MRGTKRTLQSFGARKRAMKLVRAPRLSARTCADGDRADGTCGAASASSTQESGRIDAPSSGTPAPPVQEFVVTSAPGVSCSSTVPSASSLSSASSAIASLTVHLRTSFLTCEEKEAADQQRAAVQRELGAMPATERKFQAMECDHEAATATSEGETFLLVQMDALDDLLSRTPCHRCPATGMKCLGCQIGPKPGDTDYACWLENHVGQKNTDSKSGRMEVEAAIILF
ncbi:hypothetical protein HPB52_024919 [Rhipicephalus sanguineus]|uniref:Uncharacterized protein n=1 Tax=Rhipicephalus sanguineus TaxID=34632 RepID=A0A9D4P8X7_RHISA|nr:hypothetical protein HPB52_024919 [Rhipicephalus sanguineus]